VQRDLNDGTPPTLSLTLTASKGTDSGLQTVDFGTAVEITPAAGSLIAKASDDDGVGWVEIYFTEKKTCQGPGGTASITGPGLIAGPAQRTEGQVSDTDAPSSLSAVADLNAEPPRQQGCVYEYAVWARAANAATTPVETTSPQSIVTLRA
jgi:hypothetical protein